MVMMVFFFLFHQLPVQESDHVRHRNVNLFPFFKQFDCHALFFHFLAANQKGGFGVLAVDVLNWPLNERPIKSISLR